MFILKLLTIIFFMYSFITLFHRHAMRRNGLIKIYEKIKKLIIEKGETRIKDEDIIPEVAILLIIVIASSMFYLLEFIYLLFSVKHDPFSYVVITYIMFWLIMAIKCFIKSKGGNIKIQDLSVETAIKHTDKKIEKLKKVSTWSKIQYFIDFTFYTYMIYILFIY